MCSRPHRSRLPIVALAAAGLLAACGGGQTLSKDEYVLRMQEIQQDPGGQTEALGSAMANPQLPDRRWKRVAEEWLKRQRAALEKTRDLRPPSDISKAHQRYVDESARWLGSMERLVKDVEGGSVPRGKLETRAERLGAEYAERVGPVAEEIESAGYDVFQPFNGSSQTS